MKKKISIYDIAKYINVSPATVSYVINGVHKVSEKTKQKVLAAIEELGYVPDHNARSLSTGKSHLIGLFLPLDDALISIMGCVDTRKGYNNTEHYINDVTIQNLKIKDELIDESYKYLKTNMVNNLKFINDKEVTGSKINYYDSSSYGKKYTIEII